MTIDYWEQGKDFVNKRLKENKEFVFFWDKLSEEEEDTYIRNMGIALFLVENKVALDKIFECKEKDFDNTVLKTVFKRR
jgi:hypothetical protein